MCLKASRFITFIKAIQLASGDLGFASRLSDSKSYILTDVSYNFFWFSKKCV